MKLDTASTTITTQVDTWLQKKDKEYKITRQENDILSTYCSEWYEPDNEAVQKVA